MKWDVEPVTAAFQSLSADLSAEVVAQEVQTFKIAAWAGHSNTRARARPATRQQTLAELKKLCELCRELHEHIEHRMHSPALRMVEAKITAGKDGRATKGKRPLYHPLLLNIQLEGMFEASRAALIAVKNDAELPQPNSRGQKPDAAMIANVCLRDFERLTGRRASVIVNSMTNEAGGPFVDFLAKIFVALGIKASPVSQARTAIEKRASETG